MLQQAELICKDLGCMRSVPPSFRLELPPGNEHFLPPLLYVPDWRGRRLMEDNPDIEAEMEPLFYLEKR